MVPETVNGETNNSHADALHLRKSFHFEAVSYCLTLSSDATRTGQIFSGLSFLPKFIAPYCCHEDNYSHHIQLSYEFPLANHPQRSKTNGTQFIFERIFCYRRHFPTHVTTFGKEQTADIFHRLDTLINNTGK